MKDRGDLQDTYFRRLFVPTVISILVIAAIVVILYVPPGTPLKWPTFPTALQRIYGGALFKK